MNKLSSILKVALACSLFMVSGHGVAAYVSGSSGADGAFNPTTNQSIQLPEDGIFNYTTVNIPSGVTITYLKNAANTPVTILASGDVTIVGTIDVSATTSDITSGGLGGPGGFDGGVAGTAGGLVSGWVNGYTGANVGRAGLGPGGGAPGSVHKPSPFGGASAAVGGGGAYGTAPNPPGGSCPTTPGGVYGNATLIPLIGGSGGGGGAGGPMLPGSGGGGGGGAILIASSGTINVTGSILAKGGAPASLGAITTGRGAAGGGGSGGAIRLIANTVSGDGVISASGGFSVSEHVNNGSYGGTYYVCSNNANGSHNGGNGRIRIDTESLQRTTTTTPPWSRGTPTVTFVPGLPTLAIESIGGVTVPSGNSSITLPTGFTNPVTVTFITSGVTVGSSIKLIIIPAQGLAFSATSAPTTGTTNTATASISVALNSGSNTLQASVTYTVVASVGDAMSVYAQGERVEKVTLASTLGSQESQVTLTTVSGKEYMVPSSVLALAALQS